MKVSSIICTRPEIIKFSPVLPLLDSSFDHILIHTGQHYDYEMDSVFFSELHLKKPDYNLSVGSGKQGAQTGIMLEKIESILINEKIDMVLVLGDTNTVLAGALAASKIGVKVGHIESGCRSYNRSMPEEINRVIVDHISDILFASDTKSISCLAKEGLNSVEHVGSTVFDACKRNVAFKDDSVIGLNGLEKDKFILLTLHRAGNTDDVARLKRILSALNDISFPIVFPIHPRTSNVIEREGIILGDHIKVIKPQGYLSFLSLLDNCRFIISDSGGIQEEALFFNKPCLIPRADSEWMRIVEAGKNFLVDDDYDKIVGKSKEFIKDDSVLEAVKGIDLKFETGVAEKIIGVLKS